MLETTKCRFLENHSEPDDNYLSPLSSVSTTCTLSRLNPVQRSADLGDVTRLWRKLILLEVSYSRWWNEGKRINACSRRKPIMSLPVELFFTWKNGWVLLCYVLWCLLMVLTPFILKRKSTFQINPFHKILSV